MRITLKDLVKIVFACAVACAFMTPMARLVQIGFADLGAALIIDAMVVPLVWVLLAYPLVRRGSGRTLLIDSLLLWAVCVPLLYVSWWTIPPLVRMATRGFDSVRGFDRPAILAGLVVLVPLASLSGFLAIRVVRGVRTRRATEGVVVAHQGGTPDQDSL